jgi:hypothetical protein
MVGMDSPLQFLEDKLRHFLEDYADRVGEKTPLSLLSHELMSVMQHNLIRNNAGTFIAPGAYSIHINPSTIENWDLTSEWKDLLIHALKAVAVEEEIIFDSPVSIEFKKDAEIQSGALKVVTLSQPVSLEDTVSVPVPKQQKSRESYAVLRIGETTLFILNKPVINIGRRSDNQLVLSDPRVSRRHAQIRLSSGKYLLCDLNSTGGTFVNGEQIGQRFLQPGDVISLSGFAMIFALESE